MLNFTQNTFPFSTWFKFNFISTSFPGSDIIIKCYVAIVKHYTPCLSSLYVIQVFDCPKMNLLYTSEKLMLGEGYPSAWGHTKPKRTNYKVSLGIKYSFFPWVCSYTSLLLHLIFFKDSLCRAQFLTSLSFGCKLLEGKSNSIDSWYPQYILVRVYYNCTINHMSVSPYFIKYLERLLRAYKLLQDNMNLKWK